MINILFITLDGEKEEICIQVYSAFLNKGLSLKYRVSSCIKEVDGYVQV